jgi:amino acid transporter/nucleotide-binding universal stress UspA family protein
MERTESGPAEANLIRELGVKEGVAIGLGTMVGAGIFVLSALAAERAGPAAAASYILAGVLCLLIALVISELATGMPKAGGSYTFITQALGPLAGSIVGPGNWLGLSFAGGFYLLAAGEYIAMLVPVPPWAASAVVGLLFTWLNYRGAKITGSVQNVVVIVLVLILAAFVIVGIPNVDIELYRPYAPRGWGAVAGTIGLIIVSFTGFEKVSTVSEEMKNPGRNLPLSIIGSVVIATVLYALILTVMTGTFPYTEIARREAPLVEAAGEVAGPVGTALMLAAAILATLSSANAAIMASSRISYGMARDGVLPGWFSHIHSRHKTPTQAILVTGALAILLSFSGQAEALAEISSTLFMVAYAMLCLAVVVMRVSRPPWYRPVFRLPLYPVVPIVGGMLCLAVIATMAPESRLAGLGLVAASLVWYLVWVRRQAKVNGEFGPLWERERPLEGVIEAAQGVTRPKGHEVLVPLVGDLDVRPLVSLAAALAEADDERVVVALEPVIVPEHTPLNPLEDRLIHGRPAEEGSPLARFAQQAAERGVPVRPLRRAAHAAGAGVLAVVESRPGVELLLLGWQCPLSAGQIYGSPSKVIFQNAHCNAAILCGTALGDPKKVLVPAGGGPHARLGLRLAAQIARSEDAELTLLRIAFPGKDLNMEAEMRALHNMATDVVGPDPRVHARIVVSTNIVDSILEEAREGRFELLVIGASNEWIVKSVLCGAIPDTVADRAPCPVLMVRRYEASGISTARRLVRSVQAPEAEESQ